ncbi:hypothetical protein [Rhodovulum sulfidophilum]|uniref:hypothetical protein n=1 Tax=Rhodovulum sulfidophilum TaxID=35806 RepID=UPI001920FEB0|nr:hypothetical protein [Rhodovulum sulfidophilum]MBL3559444.1 hypothetical protein [Rhodovulum sulfidophilum]
MIGISLIGPTGSGKSTIARHIERTYGAEVIKVAKPLYDFQAALYDLIGVSIEGQDGELLQFLGGKIEKEAPGWLCADFLKRVAASPARFVVNDDCRPNCYSSLLNAGFEFVYVVTLPEIRQVRLRNDHTLVDPNHSVERGVDPSICFATLDNSGELDQTLRNCDEIIRRLNVL